MNYPSKNARLQSYKNFPLFGIPIFRPFRAEKSTPPHRSQNAPYLGEILNNDFIFFGDIKRATKVNLIALFLLFFVSFYLASKKKEDKHLPLLIKQTARCLILMRIYVSHLLFFLRFVDLVFFCQKHNAKVASD